MSFFAAVEAFFAVGTIGFWLLMVVAFLAVTALEENNSNIWALLTIIVTLEIAQLLKPLALHVMRYPWSALEYLVGYFVAGTIWGVIKWIFFLHGMLGKFNEFKEKFIDDNGLTHPRVDEKFDYDAAFIMKLAQKGIEFNPKARDHKEDILRWMTFWPFSFVWTMVSDPITKAFRYIYQWEQKSLQRISDKIFSKADLKLPAKR